MQSYKVPCKNPLLYCMETKSQIFDQIFGIRFFVGSVSVDFLGFWGVIFGGFGEAL